MNIIANPSETAVKRLLSAAKLPVSDITDAHLAHFFGWGEASALHGVVGLELYGDIGLLRSLAVDPSRRGAGIGSQLVIHAERHAKHQGVRSLYLLTTDAANYFERFGYCRAQREDAPAAIRGTKQFSDLCPASATFMVKHLSTALTGARN